MGTLIIAFTLLTGCTTLKGVGDAISAGLKGTPEVTCTQVAQEGCLTLRVMNLQFDEKKPFMRGLDKPSLNAAMRADRIKIVPVEAYKAYVAGEATATSELTAYVIYLWNIDKSVSTAKMNAWSQNGKVMTRGLVEDVTATTPAPVLDTSSKLGAPDKVFRVVATGKDAGAVLFQTPWSLFTKDSVVMVDSTRTSIYPGPHNAVWITSVYLNNTMRQGGWKTANLVFLYEPTKKMGSALTKPSTTTKK